VPVLDAPAAKPTDPVCPQGVLIAWQRIHGPLDERLRATFLAHPALPGICAFTPEEVVAELAQHRKLDDLHAALRTSRPGGETSAPGT